MSFMSYLGGRENLCNGLSLDRLHSGDRDDLIFSALLHFVLGFSLPGQRFYLSYNAGYLSNDNCAWISLLKGSSGFESILFVDVKTRV